MVVAARGGRSGVRECTTSIRSCLALLLPSLFLLFLLSWPLSLLITISSSTTKNTNTKPPTSIHNTHTHSQQQQQHQQQHQQQQQQQQSKKKHSHCLLKCRIFRLFVLIWCFLPFIFVLKIDCYCFVENHRFSKIPVIRKSIRFPWKTMILPMSRARPNDKFGSGWSQHCLHFSTFWREAMKNLEALHLSIVWPFRYFSAKRCKM